MTEKKPGAKKTAKKGEEAVTDEALRHAVLMAALPHAAFDGFSDATLNAAARDAGLAAGEAARLFPEGPLDLVAAFSHWADDAMEARLAAADMASLKIRRRIARAVQARLEILRPHKEAARRAAAMLSLPMHAGLAMKLLYRSIDIMWRAAGDASTDFNFYTKRAILGGVYSATLVRWFTDDSEDEAQTRAFLDARIENVMQFEKLKANVKARLAEMPAVSSLFAGLFAGFGARARKAD